MSNDPLLDAIKGIFSDKDKDKGKDKDKNKNDEQAAGSDWGAQSTASGSRFSGASGGSSGSTTHTPEGGSSLEGFEQGSSDGGFQATLPPPPPSFYQEPEHGRGSSQQAEQAPSRRHQEETQHVDPNASVQTINGYSLGYAFLDYYRQNPEIGLPRGEQQGDVGGYQMFDNAILHWTGTKVKVEWRKGHEPQQQHSSNTNSAAADAFAAVANAANNRQRTYVVQNGDSLSEIAQRFYGHANQWKRIYTANRDQIDNPDLIYAGQELIIPE